MGQEENTAPRQVRPASALLAGHGPGRAILDLGAKQTVIAQGDPATAVYYVRRGHVQMAVVSEQGKEAVVAILTAGDFFGEGCVGWQTIYHSSAVTMTPCSIVRIERNAMLRLLQEQPAILDAFMNFLLLRSFRIESDLVDQIFNSTERRLARALSVLADQTGDSTKTHAVLPRISQEVLAAKVGTTRSRINFLMNKFRKFGFVEYSHASRILVRPAQLSAIAEDPAIEFSAALRPPANRDATRPAPTVFSQAGRWRKRAAKYRALAETMRTPGAKETYTRLARTYDRMAERSQRNGRKNLTGPA